MVARYNIWGRTIRLVFHHESLNIARIACYELRKRRAEWCWNHWVVGPGESPGKSPGAKPIGWSSIARTSGAEQDSRREGPGESCSAESMGWASVKRARRIESMGWARAKARARATSSRVPSACKNTCESEGVKIYLMGQAIACPCVLCCGWQACARQACDDLGQIGQ